MTPDTLAKSNTEHAHQRAFFAWVAFASYRGFESAHKWGTDRMGRKEQLTGADVVRHYPELSLFHAIPNGGQRDKITAGKLKAEGVKPGVLDTFLPVVKPFNIKHYHQNGAPHYAETHWYHGLYIEFKDQKRRAHADGGLSVEQVKFMQAVRDQGYCARVAYTWREAANLTMLYYDEERRFDTWGKPNG